MLILQLLPVMLSLVVLAAHFVRHGQPVLVFLSLAAIGLLAVPRRWAALVLQVALLLGAAEWARTLVILVRLRTASGEPVDRMAIILSAVAVATAASALVFRTRRARSQFRAPAHRAL
jgi:hypothetical protein